MVRKILAAALFSTMLGGIALAAPQTFTGQITDTMCGKKHMIPGKSAAECTRTCVQQKAGYGIVVGDKVYQLEGNNSAIAPFDGKNATVRGEVAGNRIAVTSITAAK